tara:strand:+ start:240 stop:623 length:384 start_codon:yes stop_codon:yes gene_type:complete
MKNKINTINVKKFDTRKDALEFQKSITGEYYFRNYREEYLEKNMDTKKGNNLPYMVDTTNGDIYYIWNCDDNLKCLNKFSNNISVTSHPFKRVFLKDNVIEVEEQGEIVKNNHNRKILAELNQIVTS